MDLFKKFHVTRTDGATLPETAIFFPLRMDEHGQPIETAAARNAAIRYAELAGDGPLEDALRKEFNLPRTAAISSLAALSESMPDKHIIRFEYPPNSGNFKTVEARLLTGEELVEVQKYDPDDVVPPKWGATPPDVAPGDREGEFDLKHPDYLAARRHKANLTNAYLMDKCIGLGLPEGVSLEDKAKWLAGETVPGLPVNRTPHPLRVALINAVFVLNFGRVLAQADFT